MEGASHVGDLVGTLQLPGLMSRNRGLNRENRLPMVLSGYTRFSRFPGPPAECSRNAELGSVGGMKLTDVDLGILKLLYSAVRDGRPLENAGDEGRRI